MTICSLVMPSVARFDMNHFYVCNERRSPVQVVCTLLEVGLGPDEDLSRLGSDCLFSNRIGR